MKKRCYRMFFIILFVCFPAVAGAQQITVKDISELMNDLSARTQQVLDKSGNPCAIVKVDIPSVEGMVFNEKQVIKQDYTPGEYILYVPQGTKKIDFKHKKYYPGTIQFSDFDIKVQSNVTYKVVLLAKGTSSEPDLQSQWVVFNITPKTAIVTFDGEPILTDSEGFVQKFVAFGNYQYVVEAPDYHSELGNVLVSDNSGKVMVNIDLKPAFGWFSIPGIYDPSAIVYVDNKIVGSLPLDKVQLSSGDHTVKIVRKLYGSIDDIITVNDSETTIMNPTFKAAFSVVTIKAPFSDADIYVNNEFKGTGVWTGELSNSRYIIEARKDSHRPSIMEIEVNGRGDDRTYNLDPLEPVYGSVNVNSSPIGVDIYLDDVKVGETPLIIPEVLIGKHTVRLSKNNLASYEKSITVDEGETEEVFGTLLEEGRISIGVRDKDDLSLLTSRATIKVDGRVYNGFDKYSIGLHTISVTFPGYMDLTQEFEVQQPGQEFVFQLSKAIHITLDIGNLKNPTVWVDGTKYELTNNTITVPYGKHVLKLDASGKKRQEITVDATSDRTVKFVLNDSVGKKILRGVGYTVGAVLLLGLALILG